MDVARTFSRTVLLVALWTGIGLGASLLAAAAVPLALGKSSFVVESGSMAPAIETGDMVVVEPISPRSAAVGEIVTFKDPEGSEKLITHRAVAIDGGRERIGFVTQGDANTGREQWSVRADGEIGRVLYRVPKLGFAIAWIGSSAGRIGFVIVPALLLGIVLLIRIWRDPEPVPEGVGARTHGA